MSGSSPSLRVNECRDVLFWLLLLGSWQFLASSGSRTGVVGAVGTSVFLHWTKPLRGRRVARPVERNKLSLLYLAPAFR